MTGECGLLIGDRRLLYLIGLEFGVVCVLVGECGACAYNARMEI
jgi:hypothetical protein